MVWMLSSMNPVTAETPCPRALIARFVAAFVRLRRNRDSVA